MIKFLIKYIPCISILFCIWITSLLLVIVNFAVSDIMEEEIVVYNGECSVSDMIIKNEVVYIKMSCGDYGGIFSSNKAALAIVNTTQYNKTPACEVTVGSLSNDETFVCKYE